MVGLAGTRAAAGPQRCLILEQRADGEAEKAGATQSHNFQSRFRATLEQVFWHQYKSLFATDK